MASEETMRAVFLTEPEEFELREVPVPEVGPRDVLVAVKACGVCGSDIHFTENGRIGDFVVREPLVLGHEAAGEVVRVGPEVKTLGVRDRVAMEPGIPCGHCDQCHSGRYNLCPDVVFLSAPPHDGFFQEYAAVPEDFAYRLPDGMSMEAGATVEPLAVGLHATNMAGLKPGDHVVVLGAGPIGLLTTASARARGATDITTVDLLEHRLEFALRMGATRVLNAAETDARAELENAADVVLDCATVDETLDEAFDIVRPGGCIAWVGMAAEAAKVPFQKFQVKELRVTGVFRYANCFRTAVELIGSGQIDTDPLITDRFDFPEVEEAVKFAAANRQSALKTMVNYA